ncbi:jg5811 [Pararge aegeria aegeria]|uniref:Jg5811 protein n=1 Tax=Pararge aegeria aegeria TaxID=348720 RepID=A0A8S4R3F3_9NEOP|nr:jg5811 [Pararge aegeria aegeria]
MADRGKHRVAPVPAPTKKQYAYSPCPRSEEVGTEFALQLLRTHHHEPPTPEKQPDQMRKLHYDPPTPKEYSSDF